MKWDEIGEQPCPVAKALSVLGDRWTMLILRNAFMGVRRFDDFQSSLGLTRHVLSDRLKRLVEHEILVKVPYVSRQQRFEYQLTEKGLDLYPILLSMMQWSENWMGESAGKPVEFVHKNCKKKLNPKVVCAECDAEIHVKDIQIAAGSSYLAFFEHKPKMA